MEHVRWGIIGCGNVTEVKSGPGLRNAERSSLVHVMRRDAEACRDYAERHKVPRWSTDATAVIDDPEVDAVYIATPPDSHASYTLAALAAGKPVYVEKPMARTAAECERMVAAAQAANQPLFVAYYRRAMPRFVTVKTLLDQGRIGTVHAVHVRNQRPAPIAEGGQMPWRIVPQIAGGGHFVDLASHTLDLLDHVVAPLTSVSGHAETRAGLSAAEDTVTATWQFEGGALGSGLWCYAAGESRDEVEILGDRGTLRFSSFGEEPLRLTTAGGTEHIPAPYPETVQQPLIQNIVDVLTGHDSVVISSGTTALRTARVIDQVLASHRARVGISFD